MTEWVRFDVDGGERTVLVEIGAEPGLARLARGDDRFAKARVTLEKALTDVRNAASTALRQFRTMPEAPDEVEIQFGVKLSAESGALIAKTGAEGHFDVTLKWIRSG
jgi:hypothetical protein